MSVLATAATIFGAIVAAGWLFKPFPAKAIIRPLDMKKVADQLRHESANEDEFIMKSWDYVAKNVQYLGYGSNVELVKDGAWCDGTCDAPFRTLDAKSGNCVAMSAMLVSILRNYMSAEQVFMAAGEISIGGHAWVVVQRSDRNWYLLEATDKPNGWHRVESLDKIYTPYVHFNDVHYYCNQGDCRNG